MLKWYMKGEPPAVFPKKRSVLLLAAVVLLLCCCLVVPAAAADKVDISTGSINITESGYTVGTGPKTSWSSGDHTLTVTGSSADNNITVISGVCTIVLQDATITPSNDPAISICANDGGTGATVTLVVEGENTLKGGTGCAAVEVKAGWDDDGWSEVCSGSLIITGSGTLFVTGGDGSANVGGGAGIGGNGVGVDIHTDGGNFGSICIAEEFSGKINAKGGNTSSLKVGAGAGIGGGGVDCGWIYSGVINICNGTIISNGGDVPENPKYCPGGAGIGTGASASDISDMTNNMLISIVGGTITAHGKQYAAGIGGGANVPGGIIDISGGTVTAYGGGDNDGYGGAGIGSGENAGWTSITIHGDAMVEAHGSESGTGIGGQWIPDTGTQTITISDTATVSAYGGQYGPGIGVGGASPYPEEDSGSTSIVISSTKPVIAVAGLQSYAIGGGSISYFGKVSLQIGESAKVWAFNRDSDHKSAVDWNSMTIADGTVAVAYTHQNGDFPAAHEQHEVTRSTDGTTWSWQHHLETSQISTFQNDPVMIEIFPEGSTTAAASHTEFYGGNWAYLGTVGQSYIIKATAGPNGSITPSGEVSVDAGSDQTFTFMPDDGYTVAEVRVDDEVVAPSASYTFTNVQADHTIHVTFTQKPTPPVPIPPSGGGSSDGNMDNAFRVLFNDGATTLFVVTDLSYGDKLTKPEDPVKDGYTFAGWHKDAACTQAWDFADGIAGDMTLYAKWTPVQTVTPTVTPTATASVTPTVTAEPTGLPTTTPTVQPTGEDDGDKPAGSVLPLIGGILILILAVLLLLFLLLRHTVTFLIPAGGEITEYRIKVWHGRYIDPADLPELLRTAAWYRDPARQERWNFNEDRVTKSIELYLG